ncbi:hypothetical protein HanPSC8_Chr12g0516961 [Helianthus annuus]|nr:hypothetical protein HanPSC8_Chr12g0516961 [Helianthus annuus]
MIKLIRTFISRKPFPSELRMISTVLPCVLFLVIALKITFLRIHVAVNIVINGPSKLFFIRIIFRIVNIVLHKNVKTRSTPLPFLSGTLGACFPCGGRDSTGFWTVPYCVGFCS